MPSKNRRFSVKGDRLAEEIALEYKRKGYSPERAKEAGYAALNARLGDWQKELENPRTPQRKKAELRKRIKELKG